MTFGKNTDIRTDIYLSLNVKYGSWWQNPTFGCRLAEIGKVTGPDMLLAEQYVSDSLQWLVTAGRASSVDVSVSADANPDRMDIGITAVQSDGYTVYYRQFNDVRTGKAVWTPVGGP
jgi:phage gp46-like protein